MNRSLKLSVLVALALGTGQAMALDLGQIQVKSALGQPLLAEIPLSPANPAEWQNLTVQLASTEEFARAGIVGGRPAIPLHFGVANGAGGKVIRITSSVAVDDPYLDLLLEVNGSGGKSVREFAILLDPPNAPAYMAAAPEPPAPRAARSSAAATPPPVRAATAESAVAPAVGDGQYGPVEHGQTLSGIARSTAPAGVDVQQMMIALRQANPDAFYRDNINALKTGAVLRMPTSAEAQVMTIAAAAAEVRRQNGDWRAGTPGKPVVVADAATRASTATTLDQASAGSGDRLALVPAKDGNGAGARGNGEAGGGNAAGVRQNLQRTQESLASLQQQSSDLKSRLKDLEDINGKNERLLSLKDNEIAELQAQLAKARKSAVQPAAAAASTTSVAKPAVSQGGDLETATASASTVGAGPLPVAASSNALASAVPATAASTPVASPPVASTSVASPKPARPARASVPAPAVGQPWYMQTWAWAAGAGAIVLLILLALLGRRRRPAAAAAETEKSASLADRFGATHSTHQGLAGEDDVDQDELLDQLAEHPDDIGLHLELVTLYYSRRDVEHFEAAAEAMHAHVVDTQQDEWQDVLHMGEDLVPGHPLFDHHAELPAHDEAEARSEFDIDDYADKSGESAAMPPLPPLPESASKKVSEYNFNFDLTRSASDAADRPSAADDDIGAIAPPAAGTDASATSFDETASAWQFDESDDVPGTLDSGHELGEFNDDPIDTKLDLARAYLDMGDADGARAMLDEVIKEGSQMQQDVARSLLQDLH